MSKCYVFDCKRPAKVAVELVVSYDEKNRPIKEKCMMCTLHAGRFHEPTRSS